MEEDWGMGPNRRYNLKQDEWGELQAGRKYLRKNVYRAIKTQEGKSERLNEI